MEAKFDVEVSKDDCIRFAEVSGDWNPLHTDPVHSAASVYGSQVLHGAFSAGLISRLAGMYLPGKDCLLYGMKLRFVNPILPPISLTVNGKIVAYSNEVGKVEASVINKVTGELYVDATYEFGMHRMAAISDIDLPTISEIQDGVILVTGTGGGLGGAVLKLLGTRGKAIKRNSESGKLSIDGVQNIENSKLSTKIAAIIHCGWPKPDNRRFIDMDDPSISIEQHLAGPIKDIQALSSFIASNGAENASLILVGSTFANTGRHYYRMPLYSIAKSTIPTLVNLLALELASKSKRCYGVIFDVLDGGMNRGISEATKMANADRSPWGELGSPDEAAKQIIWLLENQSKLINGSIITLSGGAIP